MAPHDPAAAARPLAAGTLILGGRFRLQRLLGEGGMGLVYLAEQVSLARPVAVKVLRDDLTSQQGMSERFRREAKLLSQVEHQAVVRVIDFGMHGPSACLVMEYAEGETLEDVLQRGPLPVARAVPLLVQLCQGLAAIHEKGIVHRDLKPENVMLTPVAGGEQARLLDFGIARLASPEATDSVTQVGIVLGTPEVVSPEQAMGYPPDARSDLYSLGVVAYRMLSGTLPFPGPSAQELIAQHVRTPPRPLVEAAPALAAHPALCRTVMSCLDKVREQRPQTAQALATELSRSVAPPPPAPAAPPTRAVRRVAQDDVTEVSRLAPLRGRNMRWGIAGGAVALAVGIGALFLLWPSNPARQARRLIDAGRGSEALQVIDDVPEGGRTPRLQVLRAAALHQVGRHDEEAELLRGLPESEPVESVALDGIAEDFARKETGSLRRLMAGFPKASVLPRLQAMAQGEPGRAQWGALRFVDQEHAGQGLPLVPLYIRSLESADCRIRTIAAKRLGELRNPAAIEPLRRVKEQPKRRASGAGGAEEECGHNAAAAALRQLERELTP